MEGWQETTIHGDPKVLESWVQTLSEPLPAAWARRPESEAKVKIRPDIPWPICLRWSGAGRYPATSLFLSSGPEATLSIDCIVSSAPGPLQPEQRQAVLDALHADLIDAKGADLVVETRMVYPQLRDGMSFDATYWLDHFLNVANRTAINENTDLVIWYSFLLELHRHRSWPQRDLLEQELKMHGFSTEVIGQLLNAVNVAAVLLDQYDDSWRNR